MTDITKTERPTPKIEYNHDEMRAAIEGTELIQLTRNATESEYNRTLGTEETVRLHNKTFRLHVMPKWVTRRLEQRERSLYRMKYCPSYGVPGGSILDHWGVINIDGESCLLTQPYTASPFGGLAYCVERDRELIEWATEFANVISATFEIIRPGWHHPNTVGFVFRDAEVDQMRKPNKTKPAHTDFVSLADVAEDIIAGRSTPSTGRNTVSAIRPRVGMVDDDGAVVIVANGWWYIKWADGRYWVGVAHIHACDPRLEICCYEFEMRRLVCDQHFFRHVTTRCWFDVFSYGFYDIFDTAKRLVQSADAVSFVAAKTQNN